MNALKVTLTGAACLIAGASFVAASPALSKPLGGVTVTAPRLHDYYTEKVSYADLNLSSAEDESRLVGRVRLATDHVCPDKEFALSIKRQACRSYAWNGAKPQIALAVERAKQIASNGFSSIAPVAILISVAR